MIRYVEKGPYLHEAIAEAGHVLYSKDGQWVYDDEEAVQTIIDNFVPPDSYRKLEGVLFEGIQCSATSADQAGLTAVLLAIQLQGAGFRPTRFEFENGNVLVITLANYQAFISAWLPFRQSFFEV